jgi:hypothetical protein
MPIKVLNSIEDYTVYNNNVLYVKNNSLNKLEKDLEYKLLDYPNSMIYKYGEFIKLSKYKYDYNVLIDLKLNQKQYSNPNYSGYDDKYIYEFVFFDFKTTNLIIRNRQNEVIVSQINFDFLIHFITSIEDIVVFRKESGRNIITAVDLIEFKVVWSYSLTQYPKYIDDFGDEREIEIDGEIKVFGTQLLVPCYNHIFLCLDIQTGGLLWENKETKGYHPVYYNQSVCFMTTKQFLELDIETGKTIRNIDVSKTFIEHQLEINATWHETIIYKDKIYRVYSQEFFITIMNYNTLTYEGKIEIKKSTKKSWQIGDMKIHENKLYILEWVENSKNLHIIDL